MIHKKRNKKNLINLPCRFIELEKNSPQFFNVSFMPEQFTAGKNLFKFRPIKSHFSKKEPIQIEVLDFNGNPIYHEVLDYKESDGSLVVAVYVYKDTPAGNCSITMIASTIVDENIKPLPSVELTTNNFKYVHTLYVDPNKRNDTEIIYTTEPTFSVKERKFSIVEEKFTGQKIVSMSGIGTYTFTSDTPKFISRGAPFLKQYKNGIIKFNSLSSDYEPRANFQTSSFSYTASITEVRTPFQMEFSEPAKIYGLRSESQPIKTVYNQPYEVTFSFNPSIRNVTQNVKTYAQIDIDGLDPSVGSVDRIKVFYKSSFKPKSEYQLIYDDIISPRNVLVDTGSNLIEYPIGVFDGTNTVSSAGINSNVSLNSSDYWNIELINSAPSSSKVILNNRLFDTIQVVPSLPMSGSSEIILVQTSSASIPFFKDTDYRIKFDYYVVNSDLDSRGPKIQVYASGSSFVNDTEFGAFVGEIPTGSRSNTIKLDYEMKLPVNTNGSGILKFLTRAGCSISNIRIIEDIDFGFTPHRTRLYVPLKQDHRLEYLDFKVEFFNYTLKESNAEAIVYDTLFKGGNHYIYGDDNIITGSTVISPYTSSGIELYGNINSGSNGITSGSSIRSYGYGGIENAKSGSSGFGFGITVGNPFNSTSYSDTSIQVINEAGNVMDFRSGNSSFNFYLTGISSSFVVGKSGSANTSFGEGGTPLNYYCIGSQSYIKWDGCHLIIEGAVDSNGLPIGTGTNTSGTSGTSGSSGVSGTSGSSGTSGIGSSGTSGTSGTPLNCCDCLELTNELVKYWITGGPTNRQNQSVADGGLADYLYPRLTACGNFNFRNGKTTG